jgi:hypothetical protein
MEVTRCLASEDTMHDENAIKIAQRDGTAALIYCQRRAAIPDKLEYMGDVARGGCWIWSAKSRNKSDVAFQSLGMRGSSQLFRSLYNSCKDQQLTGYCIHRVCRLLPRSS